MEFADFCTQCFRELRQVRLTPRDEGWRGRLAWHRARLGALLTSDAELDKRMAVGSGRRSFAPVEVRAARVDALMGEVARRRALTAGERRVEAMIRRRLAADNLAELRGRVRL